MPSPPLSIARAIDSRRAGLHMFGCGFLFTHHPILLRHLKSRPSLPCSVTSAVNLREFESAHVGRGQLQQRATSTDVDGTEHAQMQSACDAVGEAWTSFDVAEQNEMVRKEAIPNMRRPALREPIARANDLTLVEATIAQLRITIVFLRVIRQPRRRQSSRSCLDRFNR